MWFGELKGSKKSLKRTVWMEHRQSWVLTSQKLGILDSKKKGISKAKVPTKKFLIMAQILLEEIITNKKCIIVVHQQQTKVK